MNLAQELSIVDANGKEIKCKIAALWKNNDNSYIAYTNGTFVDGKKPLFVSKIIAEGDKMKLFDIDDDSEWEYVNEYLNKHFYNKGENND